MTEALDRLLAFERVGLQISAIITEKCNLRCHHCNIAEWLISETDTIYDVEQMRQFLRKFPGRRAHLHLVGGEVMTVPERLYSFVPLLDEFDLSLATTTNLTRLPEDITPLLRFGHIGVSIDGLPEDHDANRGKGTFTKTVRNLRRLVEAGVKVSVQTSLPDHYGDQENEALIAMLLYLGIEPQRILIAGRGPGHEDQQWSQKIIESMASGRINTSPCCGWRFMSSFTITPDGELWTHYYGARKDHWHLGHLTSDLSAIRERYLTIVQSAPFFHDPVCASCEALMGCWGLGCTAKFKYDDVRPSTMCDQAKTIENYRAHLRGEEVPQNMRKYGDL